MGNIGIQPVIDRLAPAHGNTLRYHGYPCTYRIPLCANTIKIGFELWHNGRAGRKKCILANRVPALKWNIDFAKLAHIATDDNAIALLQHFLAVAPAATRTAVSRALERPPPR